MLVKEQINMKDVIVSHISSIWNLLSADEQNYLYDQLSYHTYRKNELIYSEGMQPENMMCLLSGQVKIYKVGPNTRFQIMRVIRPVQYFGYRAYFAHEPYVTNACAFENAKVALIPMKCIDHIIETNCRLAAFFIHQLATDLGISDQRSITLTQSHIRGRLAETILFLKKTYGVEADGATLSIYLSREDLAALANMTTANAIRTLSSFTSENLVVTDGRKIKIIDETALQRIARLG